MKVIKNGFAILTPRGHLAQHNAQFAVYYLPSVAKRDLKDIHDGKGKVVRVALVETK